MMKFRKENKLLEIEQDICPESPREWDNIGIMVCFHKRYNLGDEHDFKSEDFAGWDDLEEKLYGLEDAFVVLPLYLYDHSGISMSTGNAYPYNCRWDAGQVGFIYAPKDALKDWTQEWKDKHYKGMSDFQILRKILKGEVKTYDQYLRGDICGFVLYEIKTCNLGYEHKEVLDSCSGFYGHDYDANGLLESAGITDFEEWEELE